MSIKGIWVAVGTNIQVNSCSQQWKFSNRNGSDGITTTGSTQHSIYNRSWCIEDMSIKGIWEGVGANIQVDSCGQQWKFSNRNGSDGVTTTGSTQHSIYNRSSCIEDMSIKGIWEGVGTNIQRNSCGQQWKFSNRNGSDGITTTGSGGNRIGDRASYIEHMSIKGIWEAVGTNIQVNSCSQQWKFSNRNGSDGITTTGSGGNGIGNVASCIEHMSIKGIREAVGTNIQRNS